jgi:hypothetical protein
MLLALPTKRTSVTNETVAFPWERGFSNMKLSLLLGFLALVTFCPLSHADDTPAQSRTPNESQLIEHGTYINKDGQTVHSPAHTVTGDVPAGATAKCRDGTFSFSRHHSGTCSHHGGVARWLG